MPREFAFWAKEQGADVNFKDYYGKTPIFYHAAAWKGDVPLLLELGAEADVADSSGVTPLHLASLYGRVEAVKALLDAGIDVNVKSGRSDRPEFMTPLEKTLLQNRLPYDKLLEICGILLRHGGDITDRARELLRKSAENFQRIKRGVQNQAHLYSQTENLEKLYKIFDVEPAKETVFHDGVSPIHLPEQSESGMFKWLWDYLVPLSGKAQTAQGEAIRIVGRVDHEIMSNGGMNWDSNYRKMLRILSEYLRLGNPLKDEDIAQVERITHLLKDGRDDGTLSMQLCAYAVAWVILNPKVLLPLEADYSR